MAPPSPLLLLGALLVLAGAAAMPTSYQCTASVGCASNAAPSGLSKAPQIILLSHDDAITVTSNAAIRKVVNKYSNPNGCNIPFTWFVSGGSGTNCALAKRLFQDNHEIATHTLAHAQLIPNTSSMDITYQIQAQRDHLVTNCGIPAEKMVGFRAPYLVHNAESRAALQALGFTYDSSIIESWPSATSPSSSARLWPYSMAYGIPQNCEWMAPSTCSLSERYPSLWEIPMLQFESSSAVALSSMDPTASTSAELLAQLWQQFRFSYDGNRAPLGIYLHTPWFAAKDFHASTFASFIEQVLAQHDDVWFLTYSQMKAWMEHPVEASSMATWLKCNAVNFTAEERPPCTTYTVQQGDSLFSIAATQAVELADLLAINPALSNNTGGAIYVGQRLRLPPYPDTCQDALAGQPPCRNYTVVAGDSLYSVAQAAGLMVADILSVNNGTLTATSALHIDQVVRLPPWPVVECFYGNWTDPITVVPAPPSAATGDDEAKIITCGAEVLELDLQLTGFDTASFAAHEIQIKAGLAALVRESASCITTSRTTNIVTTATGQRRLMSQRSLLTDPQLLVFLDIHTSNATRVAQYLAYAQELGSLNTMLLLLGAQVDSSKWTAVSAEGTMISLPVFSLLAPAAAPVPPPAEASSPAPAQLEVAAEAATVPAKKSNLGAILGGAIGGGVGTLLVLAAVVVLVRRKRTRVSATGGTGGGGLRSSYAIANPTYTAGATATVGTSGAASAKDRFELNEVVEATGTPRSARRRANTAFN